MQRPLHGFWTYPDRRRAERGAAQRILEAAGMTVRDLRSRPKHRDPPDCEGHLNGCWSAIEVTELIHQPTLERALKARKDRDAGLQPIRPEALFVWGRPGLLRSLREKIERKDRARLKGGPYERHVLIIYTDETFLARDNVGRFLRGATFATRSITDVLFGLSYHQGDYPVFQLQLTKHSPSAGR